MLQRELLYAALGTGFTCFATILGAAMVFFFKKDLSHTTQKVFLGFAAGVMIAASVWSLLIPAMDMAEAAGGNILLPVGGGFALGGLFGSLLGGQLLGFFLLLGGYIPMQKPGKFERDLQRMAASTVGEVMSREPFTITPQTPLDEIATVMVEKRFYSLPVVEEGRLVGIVGMEDMLRRLAAEA